VSFIYRAFQCEAQITNMRQSIVNLLHLYKLWIIKTGARMVGGGVTYVQNDKDQGCSNEVQNQRTSNIRQRKVDLLTEDSGYETADRRQQAADNQHIDRRQQPADSSKQRVDSGQWTVDRSQQTWGRRSSTSRMSLPRANPPLSSPPASASVSTSTGEGDSCAKQAKQVKRIPRQTSALIDPKSNL
jgi:hypothetical protein